MMIIVFEKRLNKKNIYDFLLDDMVNSRHRNLTIKPSNKRNTFINDFRRSLI